MIPKFRCKSFDAAYTKAALHLKNEHRSTLKEIFMRVQKRTLLLIACLIWAIAGFNVLRIGVMAYAHYLGALNFVLSLGVFCVFQFFIFGKLVKKHTARILGYLEERQFFLNFFDVKSFIIMAVMMSGGITVRALNLAPERFIAVFYTGLGASLLLAGILFGVRYIQSNHT